MSAHRNPALLAALLASTADTSKASVYTRNLRAERYLQEQKKRGLRVDQLGNVVNPVRREKKLIRKEFNLTSGRAWRRWKKAAERADRALRRVA